MSTEVKMATIPNCDFCDMEAEYDFKTRNGPWAYGCRIHWVKWRFFPNLGTGKGQKLVRA